MIKLVISLINLIFLISCNDKEIKNSGMFSQVRSVDIEEISDLTKRIYDDKENSIIVFHTEWCPHCRDFIPHFDLASQYISTQNFNFFKVNCKNKSLCEHFNVKRFPTVKVFYNGKEIEDEPGRNTESVIEYINKLIAPSIFELNSRKEIQQFIIGNDKGEFYSDSNFIMVYDDKNSDFYKCVNTLVENNYKTILRIGSIELEKFNKNMHPTLIFSEKKKIIKKWNNSCEEIQKFIEDNKYPIVRKLDSSYIKRLQKDAKTVFMIAISVKNSLHTGLIENFISEISIKNRKYIFAFIDIDEDAHLVSYFKLNLNDIPKLIIYNFKDSVYYIDEGAQDSVYNTEESAFDHFSKVIIQIEKDLIVFSTGNIFQDFLAKLGIKLNETIIVYILGGCFMLIIIILVIVIFYCGNENENVVQPNTVNNLPEQHNNNINKNKCDKEEDKDDKKNN